jgi:hypothetical protein
VRGFLAQPIGHGLLREFDDPDRYRDARDRMLEWWSRAVLSMVAAAIAGQSIAKPHAGTT